MKKTADSERQAIAQFKSIKEMVANLNTEDETEREEAEQTIHEDPLSVQVRSDWHNPGEKGEISEYNILLCTGGPACRIIGELENGQPTSAKIEHQDWGTPWTEYRLSAEDEAIVIQYANCFYFGE